MDKVVDSGSTDAGSIPVWDARHKKVFRADCFEDLFAYKTPRNNLLKPLPTIYIGIKSPANTNIRVKYNTIIFQTAGRHK